MLVTPRKKNSRYQCSGWQFASVHSKGHPHNPCVLPSRAHPYMQVSVVCGVQAVDKEVRAEVAEANERAKAAYVTPVWTSSPLGFYHWLCWCPSYWRGAMLTTWYVARTGVHPTSMKCTPKFTGTKILLSSGESSSQTAARFLVDLEFRFSNIPTVQAADWNVVVGKRLQQ